MAELSIVPRRPALLIHTKLEGQNQSILVVSDLHIGFAHWFQSENVSIDWYQIAEETEKELEKIVISCKANSIVLLGDIKNNVFGINKGDWKVIPKFLQSLSQICKVYFIPGNHDSKIRLLIPHSISTIGVTGMTIDDTLLIHGHTMPSSLTSNVKKVILGHVHPVFFKSDSVMNGQKVWVFLRVRTDVIFPNKIGSIDVIIMPSYNRFIVNQSKVSRQGQISPLVDRILKKKAVEKCLILSMEGAILGNEELLENLF
jgi:uncharacterized protein